MKSHQELKDVLDLLHTVLSGDLPINFDPQSRCILGAQYVVLCFVLEHEGTGGFQRNIDTLRDALDGFRAFQQQQLKRKAVVVVE